MKFSSQKCPSTNFGYPATASRVVGIDRISVSSSRSKSTVPGVTSMPVRIGPERWERDRDDRNRQRERADRQEDSTRAPRLRSGWRVRSQDLRRIPGLGHDARDLDRFRQPLHADRAAVDRADAVDRTGQVDRLAAHEDLTGAGLAAETCGEVQGPAPVATLDFDRLASVDADPHAEREVRVGDGFVGEALLQLHRRSDRLTRRPEDRERLVPAELEEVPAPTFDPLDGRRRRTASRASRRPRHRVAA